MALGSNGKILPEAPKTGFSEYGRGNLKNDIDYTGRLESNDLLITQLIECIDGSLSLLGSDLVDLERKLDTILKPPVDVDTIRAKDYSANSTIGEMLNNFDYQIKLAREKINEIYARIDL